MIFRILFLFSLVFLLSSFLSPREHARPSVSHYVKERMDSFYISGSFMENQILQNGSLESLRHSFDALQRDFRMVQFLLEHISEETVKRYFNGPPLLSMDQSIPAVVVLEPKGLQVIDEILYEDRPDMDVLLSQVRELCGSIRKTSFIFSNPSLVEADLKMAMYKDLVRIYSLQVTGFDTPGSLNGLRNARHNFLGMSEMIRKFYPDHPQLSAISNSLLHAAEYLQTNSDFDSFDRIEFYLKHIRPSLTLLANWQVNDLPVQQRNPGQIQSLSYKTGELFSADFFNREYFANMPSDLLNSNDLQNLGRDLFYDPILSGDGRLSCASCHKPEFAFTDGLPKSITNTEGLSGNRNTPTLWNAIFTKGFFYDLREDDPSRQIAHVVRDRLEFNTDFIEIMYRLERSERYKLEFERIFPSEKICKSSITSAITAFVASLVDMDSPFDRFMRSENSNLDPAVRRGFNLFAGKAACATCHFMPTFSGLVPASYKESESEVLGVPTVWLQGAKMDLDADPGRFASGKPRDQAEHLRHSFKTTTIRNVEKTAPYMHNGSFASLEELMEFYNKGGGAGLGFDLEHQTLAPDSLGLNRQEISDLITFMKSLTGKKL